MAFEDRSEKALKAEVSSGCAILKCDVPYAVSERCALAPAGVYDIDRRETGLVRFSARNGACDFTISLDAYAQHVLEGRIAVKA